MAIKLRTNQPTALTYREMDRNFSSFFYSASVNPDTAILTLWYTGSQDLNDLSGGETYDPGRYVEINLQATSSGTVVAAVAGNNREVQFNDNGQFGASTNLIYTPIGHLGVGTNTPLQRLHVKGSSNYPAMLRLESISGPNQRANVEFYHVNTFYGSVGRDKTNDNNLYIRTFIPSNRGGSPGHLRFNIGNNTEAGAWTQVGLGIGTLAPQYQFHTEGTGYFSTGVSIGVQDTSEKLVVNGNMSTAIAAGKIGFVVSDAYNDDNYPHYGLGKKDGQELVNLSGYFGLSFGTVGSEKMRIDTNGNIGIGTQTIAEKLTVQGNISGSGNIKVNGNANIGTSLTTGTSATVGTTLTVGSTATILSVPLNTDSNPRILVQSQTSGQVGQVQYITGIVPKGAIMMWNSATAPSGWAICDGNGGNPINGVTIPDLRERFIVGAGVEPLKTVIDYSAPFTLTSYVVASVNNITYTMDTANPYYVDGAGIPRQGVNPVDGKRYHLYKGPGSTSASTFKYIIYDNRFNTYEVIQGPLPTWGSPFSANSVVIYAGDDKGGTTYFKSYESQNGRHFMSYDTFAEYDKHFVNGRRLAWKEVNWATTTSPGYAVGDKGGADNVVLLGSQAPKHQHDSVSGENNGNGATYGFTGGNNNPGAKDGDNVHNLTSAYGNNQPHENRPPYYALAFIIYTGV